MNVAIFGGANPQSSGTSYGDAYRLGQLLAQAGHCIWTGGYIGTMEAASRGAAEAGGHVVGVTCTEIETWRGVKPNAWVLEERRFATLHERLLDIIEGSDAAIALPGGVGTLLEISMLWNRMIIEALPHRPLILVGDGWKALIETFYSQMDGYLSQPVRAFVSLAADIDEAVAILQKYHSLHHHDTQ